MRILISRLSSLGDVVCCLPVAVGLKRAYPDAEVTWLCQAPFIEVPRLCWAVDRTVLILKGDRFDRAKVRGDGEFDLALDLQGIWKSGALVGASRARRKLGYHWQRELSWLFSERVLPDASSLHVVDQYADVARAAGAEIDVAEFGLGTDAQADERVRGLLAESGVGAGAKVAVFNVVSRWQEKDWPVHYYLEAGRAAVSTGAMVVFVGAGTSEATSGLCEAVGEGAVDLSGRTSVTELASLLALADLHVGGDTGTGHLAAALGIRCIALHRSTMVARSCPYGQAHDCFSDPAEVAGRVRSALEAR